MDTAVRKAVRDRVLNEMLGGIEDSTGGGWKVLVLDEFSTRVMSSSLKMSDILDCNVSMVEDLHKTREASPLMGVYFIQPRTNSVDQLIRDFTQGPPMYPSVHVFFTSKLSSEQLRKIKACGPLIKVLKTLKESNLEFLTIDSRTMSTEHPAAAEHLMSDAVEVAAQEADAELSSIASRLSTLMATLHEFPAIRYRVGKVPEAHDPPGATLRTVLTQKLSQKLLDKLSVMQRAGQLPDKETCDLLVLDRSYDAVVPVIHDWTYESMVYDLLDMEGSTFRYQVESATGKKEDKEMVIEESDSLWCELRHMFIADVYSTLGNRFKEFQSKNKAARLGGSGLKEKGGEMSSSSIRALITALPQFREVLSKLSLHIQVSSDLKQVTHTRKLTELGELEQDLVLGDKNSKDLVTYLSEQGAELSAEDKMRLFMCYCATHPEKLDQTKRSQWQKLAKLSESDMAAVCNLSFMGISVMKPAAAKEEKGGFFGGKKKPVEKKDMLRRRKDEDTYALFRFEPLLTDILKDLVAGRLPAEEFPYIREPSADATAGAAAGTAQSARTAKGGLTWVKRNGEGSAATAPARRLIVFIIGGAVRSEMRVAHDMSKALGRDIILGTTSVETPRTFIDTLHRLNTRGIDYSAL